MSDLIFSGRHNHDAANPHGLHNHPELGITELGGDHDHGVNSDGIHIHRGTDGRILVEVGGWHWHSDDEEENSYSPADHYHRVLGATDRGGLYLDDLTVAKTEARGGVIVSKKQVLDLGTEDMASIDVLAKHFNQNPVVPAFMYAIRSEWDGEGQILLLKAERQSQLTSIRGIADRVASNVAHQYGNAVLFEISKTNGENFFGLRKQVFACSTPQMKGTRAELKATTANLRKSTVKKNDAADPPVSDPSQTIQRLHSMRFDKSVFADREAKEWARRNYINVGHEGRDEDGSIIFFQDESNPKGRVHIEEIIKGVVATFEDVISNPFSLEVNFKKTDDEKRLVYGEVYVPWLVDSQGDFATPEDIEKAAHQFLLDGNLDKIDTHHDFIAKECAVVESFIARPGDPTFTPGAWVLVTKVFSDEVWDQIKKGEINGYSMAGNGQRIPMTDTAGLPLIYKSAGSYFDFVKSSVFGEEDEQEKQGKMRKKSRLTKMVIDFVSLVKRGAIRRDFAIIKSASFTPTPTYVPIFKSATQRVLARELENPETRNWFSKMILEAFYKVFGESPRTADVPTVERKEPYMSTANQPGGPPVLVVLDLLKNLLGRSAASETAMHRLIAKSDALRQVIESDPELKSQFEKLDPRDLQAVQTQVEALVKMAGVESGFLTSPPNTPLSLPPATNFFGARAGFMTLGQAMGGSMNVGSLGAQGFPSVPPVIKELTDMVAALKADLENLKKGAEKPQAVPTEFAQMQGVIKELQAKVDTMAAVPPKETQPPAPAAPTASPGATGTTIESASVKKSERASMFLDGESYLAFSKRK